MLLSNGYGSLRCRFKTWSLKPRVEAKGKLFGKYKSIRVKWEFLLRRNRSEGFVKLQPPLKTVQTLRKAFSALPCETSVFFPSWCRQKPRGPICHRALALFQAPSEPRRETAFSLQPQLWLPHHPPKDGGASMMKASCRAASQTTDPIAFFQSPWPFSICSHGPGWGRPCASSSLSSSKERKWPVLTPFPRCPGTVSFGFALQLMQMVWFILSWE